jgi:hypothetical protein
MALGNSRNFRKMQALKYRNLLSGMSAPIEVHVFGTRAFRDLIWAATP